MANDVTVSAAAQSGVTLSDKLTAAYALAPAPPAWLYVVLDASIPRHTGEALPTPPANCILRDYRTTWDAPPNERSGQVIMDFGHGFGSEGDTAEVTVAAPWVQANSIIIC